MPIFVPLTDHALERLRLVARQERRRLQDQAAVILERALGEATQDRAETLPVSSDGAREDSDG